MLAREVDKGGHVRSQTGLSLVVTGCSCCLHSRVKGTVSPDQIDLLRTSNDEVLQKFYTYH
jgi:hypothetical protein